MGNRILLLGGGGNCRSIIDVLLEGNEHEAIGVVDVQKPQLDFSDNVFYVGNDDSLEELYKEGWNNAFVSLGSVGDCSNRERLYNLIKKIGFNVPNIISRSAIVSSYAKLGEGVFVSKGAVINVGSMIGNCCIINTGSIVEHDSQISDFVHVSPGSTICGGVCVGYGSHIGAGSVVKQYLNIGSNTIIGMGSVVTSDVCDDAICYGNPCKFVRKK